MPTDGRQQRGRGLADPQELAGALVRLVDPERAIGEILRLATRWFDADWGQIILVDLESGRHLTKASSCGSNPQNLTFSTTILTDALERDEPICIQDAKTHPIFREAASIHDVDAAAISVIVVPLHDAQGTAVGGLYLQRCGDVKGFYDETDDLSDLARTMDTLAPVLLAQQQSSFFNGLRLSRTKQAIREMDVIVGHSVVMDNEVYSRIEKYAHSNQTVCIQGATGTGKEWVAQAIHRLSARAGGPFVRVACNAIPEGLAESEFFGHVRGAFAQAYQDRPSPFEQADGGTIFLDEIGALPRQIQAKLLHVLERGSSGRLTFQRVGGSQQIFVDVRVIAATNADLRAQVRVGRFREDLFYRINQLRVCMPLLRDRSEDIAPLAQGFVERTCQETGRDVHLATDAQAELCHYMWPGNVREFKSAIEQAVLLHERDGPLRAAEIIAAACHGEDAPASARKNVDSREAVPFRDLGKSERRELVRAAHARLGSPRKVADELGISRQTVYVYLREESSEKGETDGRE